MIKEMVSMCKFSVVQRIINEYSIKFRCLQVYYRDVMCKI